MSLLQGLGLSGMNSILGGSPPPGNMTAMQQYQQSSLSPNLAQQYNSQLAQQQWANIMMGATQTPQWVFNGVICKSARDMANIIWKTDCPEKTHFLLKFE